MPEKKEVECFVSELHSSDIFIRGLKFHSFSYGNVFLSTEHVYTVITDSDIQILLMRSQRISRFQNVALLDFYTASGSFHKIS